MKWIWPSRQVMRRRSHLTRCASALLIPLVALLTGIGAGAIGAVAAPCPEVTPPPPPPICGDRACPSMPNTGGGGAACQEDPTDPACQAHGGVPHSPRFGAETRRGASLTTSFTALGSIAAPIFSDSLQAPPCTGEAPVAPPGGSPPTPTPVPLIPVCAACEAPGVAAGVPLPQVQVRMNPDLGLVNLPTWFWAVGYQGQALTASRSWSAPYEPTTIVVRYTVARYIWDFGDGGQVETLSLGQAYPEASDITNVYRWSSRTEPGGQFHPSLTIEWRVEYRVDGGPPQPLPAVQRRYEASYPVQQLQPIITNP